MGEDLVVNNLVMEVGQGHMKLLVNALMSFAGSV